jgi:hypothetical protein
MSGGKIFSDVDTKCTMRRTNDGLRINFFCQDCESEVVMMHPWPEVKAMLQGHPVNGVTPTQNGWVVKVQCTEVGCTCLNSYEIGADELEDQAQRELAHRARRGVR